MAAYATSTQLLERYDANEIADLASDEGQAVTRIALLTDSKVAASLSDASGEVEAALLVGGMYTTDQLEGLTGNAAAKLVRMTCDIAMCFLYERRPLYNVDNVAKFRELADKYLDRLRKGENVFNVAANIGAGTPSVDGPTTVGYESLNLVRDRVQNYYPGRRLPNNR